MHLNDKGAAWMVASGEWLTQTREQDSLVGRVIEILVRMLGPPLLHL
jgi:hypothetical protein